LSQVLQLMKQQHSLFAKLSKCSFGQTKIEYLGHVVTQEGVQVDDSKILAIKQWPMPISVKQLRAFLGLASYYRRFIKGFALLTAPLTDLLKKDAFQWSKQAEAVFLHLKSVLTQAPMLVLPNFSQPFVLVLGLSLPKIITPSYSSPKSYQDRCRNSQPMPARCMRLQKR